LTRRGRHMVWCAEAPAWETVPADRIAPAYLMRRAFRGGQTTTFTCFAVRPREPMRALRHMAVGAGQFLLYAPAALLLRLLGRRQWQGLAAKAWAGLGKLLWYPGLHMRLYRREPSAAAAPPLTARLQREP